MNNKLIKIIFITLIAMLLTSVAINVIQYFIHKRHIDNERIEYIEKEVIVEKRDTIIEKKISYDTVYINQDKYIYDTIVVNDTVYIKDEPHDYRISEPDYTLDINAVKLNYYQLNIHRKDTLQIEKVIEKDIVYKSRSRFGVGVFAGPTYDFVNKKMGVSIGLGVTFDLTKK